MNRKFLLTVLFTISILVATGACKYQSKQNENEQQTNFKNMLNLDSLLATYTTRPTYYAAYGNSDCLFELRVNDILVDELTQPGSIGGTAASINPYILKSGKQKVSFKLYPNPGKDMIRSSLNQQYPYFKPFRLKIDYLDFKLPQGKRSVIDVYKMPDIVTPKEGIPYYEFETEFEATVPYQIEGWSNCIDLRELPDIEKRVVAEFNRVRQLMINHKFEELRQYYAQKNNELSIVTYESNEAQNQRWSNFVTNIQDGNSEDWQAIEDYKLVFEADGRSVTLRSTKKKGFPSALLWIKQKQGETKYEFGYFELHLGIKKGTDQLIPLL